MGPGADDGEGMKMEFNKIVEVISERKGAAAAVLGIAALGGLAWALSTGPLTPLRVGEGSTGSMGSHFPVAIESAGADDAPVEPEEDPASTEEAGPAAGGPTDSDPQSPAVGGGDGVGGDSDKQLTSSQGASKLDAPKPSKPKPSHTHNWNAVYRTEPVYGQQWVSKWEDVYKGRVEKYTCNGCGAPWSTAHALEYARKGDKSHGTYVDDSYDVWEKEDHGSYQTVQTGTKQVLDHYECSCGATK